MIRNNRIIFKKKEFKEEKDVFLRSIKQARYQSSLWKQNSQ